MLLVPSDPLNPRRVDPHFAPQATAARDLGIQVARIDDDALSHPEDAIAGVPAAADAVAGEGALYRGWMMSTAEYDGFAKALSGRGIALRTTADDYRTAHEFPGWYDLLREITPESVWTTGDDVAALVSAARRLGEGPAVVRDYVKSMKHYWDEAAYIPDLGDPALVERVARRFLELRGDSFTGGFVLRRFEEFSGAEARTWWIGGRCALVDGQVSDWPGSRDPADLVARLF